MIPVKVELEASTDKATRQIESAFNKIKKSVDATAASGKQFVDEANKIGPAFETAATKSLKFMEGMSKLNAAMAVAKQVKALGDEFVKSGEATKAQEESWNRINEILTGVKLLLGEIVVTVSDIAGPLSEIGDYFLGPADENSSSAERHRRRVARYEKEARDIMMAIGDAQGRANVAAANYDPLADINRAAGEAWAAEDEAAKEALRRRYEAISKANKRIRDNFWAEYNDLKNDPRLKNARIEGILSGEPGGNLNGILADADAEKARAAERNRLATDEARAKYDAAQINKAAVDSEVEGYRSRIEAAVDFMKMDRAQKAQWLKDTGTQEAIKAGAYFAEAIYMAATGNPMAAGVALAGAKHAAVAVACGAGFAAMSGGGGSTATSGGAGGGYARPSMAGANGGGSTVIINVHDSIVEADRLANKVQDALVRGQASGAVRKTSSVRSD